MVFLLKIKRRVLSALLVFCFVLSIPFQASAEEVVSAQKVKLKLTYVDIPFYENVNLVRSETVDSAKVEVFDRKTGELLNTYRETIEKQQKKSNINSITSGDYYIVTTTNDRTDGPNGTQAVTRLTVKMNVYSSGGFRQINSIESKTMAVVNSGGFTLESVDTVAISATGSFPTTEVRANGTGVITKKMTYTSLWDFSAGLSAWKMAEFNITYQDSTAKEFYARKPISVSLNYSLY